MPTPAELEALVRAPREQMHVEVKGWLDLATNDHKSVLAKAIIALANHGGGFVVVGFTRAADGTYGEAVGRPANLNPYNDDAVNGIVRSYAAPAFHCPSHAIAHPDTGATYPVIEVPGNHRVPIQAQRGSPDQRTLMNGRVYIRSPGPQSAEPATPEEWKDLLTKCLRANRDDLLDAMRDILTGYATAEPPRPALEALLEFADDVTERWKRRAPVDAQNRPRLPPGYYRLAYAVQGEFVRPNLVALLGHLRRAERPNTGWPEWAVLDRDPLRPRPVDGGLEAFLSAEPDAIVADPAHADFWRAVPDGRQALMRGFQEDDHQRVEAGTSFDIAFPMWRVGECFLHARALCQQLEVPDANVVVSAKYFGLLNRRLISVNDRWRAHDRQRSEQDVIELSATVNAASIDDTLPEIVHGFLQPLYHLFDLYDPPLNRVAEEIRRLRARG